MASRSPVDRIVDMLADEAPERRLAAIIVLGELKPKGSAVTAGLVRILAEDGPALQRHALETLTKIGVKEAHLDTLLSLLASRDAEVREAAAAAVASVGEGVVPAVRARLGAAEGEERRALESVLSRLGGAEAFDALLDALAAGDAETNRATALELRQHVKEADRATRRAYRSRLEQFLKAQAKRGEPSVSAMAAAVKVLGFLEDPKTAPALLGLARDPAQAAAVRQEALIALRFTMSGGATKEVVQALVEAAGADDRALAQTAMMTLAALELPASLTPALSALALHREVDRAAMAIDKLGAIEGKAATETLVDIVARGDKRRAELAAKALEGRADTLGPLVALMAVAEEPERVKLLRHVLKPRLDGLKPAMRASLMDAGLARLIEGSEAWEPLLGLVAEAAPKAVTTRLRAEAAKLRKARKVEAEERALRALLRVGDAEDEDRYRLASLGLRQSKLDPRARRSDRAVRHLAELAGRGFDVAKALRGDRTVALEQLYYVGFCFLEDDVGGGEELLQEVVKQGGRKKIATAAKNKLALAGRD